MPNAIFWYRIARYCYLRKIPIVPQLLRLLIFLVYNSRIPYQADIGKGTFCICKGIGVVIMNRNVIGENCRIGIGVKFVGKAPYKNIAKVGNNVYIGPGVVIVGPVIIEDNVIIAPNAVVTKSIRKGTIVGGIPAKVLGKVEDLEYNVFENPAYLDGYADYL